VLLALFCAVLVADPAAAAPSAQAMAGAPGVAVTSAYHVDVAAVAARSDSPVGSQHSTPAFDVSGGITCRVPASGAVTVGQLRSHARTGAIGPLPGVRAPPSGTTT
jgi:hypothetical protein